MSFDDTEALKDRLSKVERELRNTNLVLNQLIKAVKFMSAAQDSMINQLLNKNLLDGEG